MSIVLHSKPLSHALSIQSSLQRAFIHANGDGHSESVVHSTAGTSAVVHPRRYGSPDLLGGQLQMGRCCRAVHRAPGAQASLEQAGRHTRLRRSHV